jgi:hypothetical protein
MKVVPRTSGKSVRFITFNSKTLAFSVISTNLSDVGTFDVKITGTVNQVHSKTMTFVLTVSADVC